MSDTAPGSKYRAQDFIDAMPGTGGIISALANAVGCHWSTAKAAIERWSTVKDAWEAERQSLLDDAESLVYDNIRHARRLQAEARVPVDSSDAKWVLARLGKDRGYTERTELTGAEGRPVLEFTGEDLARARELLSKFSNQEKENDEQT